MQTSESINEIAAALAKAQGVIENPAKTRDNPHYRSKYADLATGLNCIRPALSANGIALVQATDITRDGVILHVRLIHTSGQYLGLIYPVCGWPVDHQKLAGAMTYARRQSAFALVGVCGEDEDDDGEGIQGGVEEVTISDMQVAELRAKILTVSADEQKFLRFFKIRNLSALPTRDFDRAMSELARKGNRSGAVQSAHAAPFDHPRMEQ